jgi:hypothetical protein
MKDEREVKAKRQLSGAVHPLRLQQALNALLAERLGEEGLHTHIGHPRDDAREDFGAGIDISDLWLECGLGVMSGEESGQRRGIAVEEASDVGEQAMRCSTA